MTEEASADLADLASALPRGRLSLKPRDRDAASIEPVGLTFIRQAEAAPPALPATLFPHSLEEVDDLLSEAFAAGYELDSADRPLGLSFSRLGEVRLEGDAVRFGGGTSWGALIETAVKAGRRVPAAALADRFATPLAAAEAGLIRARDVTCLHGRAALATADLSAPQIGTTDKTWLMRSEEDAMEQFDRVVRLYRPLFVELLSALDCEVLAAAGLWRDARRIGRGAAGLRLVVEGTPVVRHATVAAASWSIERQGGVCHHRGALPRADALCALAAAAGAARLAASREAALPDDALEGEAGTAVNGEASRERIVWYPRDLARSVDEASGLLGLQASTVANARSDPWEDLRAALSAAMP